MGVIEEKKIWDTLMQAIGNAYGVAGLMGNLQAESGLRADNLQNSFEKKLGMDDETYTAAVDCGAYGNFTKDSAGYGLAQWTFWTRKQRLFNYMKSRGLSIGDLDGQLDFLIHEIKDYSTVWGTLQNARTVREASDVVLTQYERPADQGESVKQYRARLGNSWYARFAEQEKTVDTKDDDDYFPACAQYHTSLVDALKSVGSDGSYATRKIIAHDNGISDYKGTAAQNLALLRMLKGGRLKI